MKKSSVTNAICYVSYSDTVQCPSDADASTIGPVPCFSDPEKCRRDNGTCLSDNGTCLTSSEAGLSDPGTRSMKKNMSHRHKSVSQ